ncbi:MAG: hypothetical protein IPJ82_05540 [Lewinellaceae bacterium]|nr:hypothetical protein [Lewinellaceae bacterium]
MNRLIVKDINVPIILGIALFIYLVLRVFIMPISDDEFITVDMHASQSWWGVLTTSQPSVDWAPNNHILNTLFVKLEIALFGQKDWAVRLHILASFAVCYYFIYSTLKCFTNSTTRQTLYLLVIFFNPYLLDFFGIARGYAMSIAAYSAAYYYIILYSEGLSLAHLRNAFIALFFSIWSNFSALYFLLLISVLTGFVIYKNRHQVDYKKHLLYIAIAGCATMLIIFLPLTKTLASSQTFGGKTGIFQDCAVHYINQYIHFNPNISRHDLWTPGWKITEVLAVICLLLWALLHLISFLFPTKENVAKIQYYSLALLAGVVIIVKILFIWKGVPYPTARTELLFSMPFYLGVCAAFERIILKQKNAVMALIVFISLLTVHFFSSVTFENTIEWWQNGDAKRVVKFLKEDLKNAKRDRMPVFGVDGWHYHSIVFYTEVEFKDVMKTEWSDLRTDAGYDYIYVPFHQKEKVSNSFEVVGTFKHGILFKAIPKKE